MPKSRCEYEAPRSAADISTIIVLINVHLNLHGPLACRLYQDATAAAAFEPPSAESAAEHLKHRGAVSLRVIISESMQLHSSFIARKLYRTICLSRRTRVRRSTAREMTALPSSVPKHTFLSRRSFLNTNTASSYFLLRVIDDKRCRTTPARASTEKYSCITYHSCSVLGRACLGVRSGSLTSAFMAKPSRRALRCTVGVTHLSRSLRRPHGESRGAETARAADSVAQLADGVHRTKRSNGEARDDCASDLPACTAPASPRPFSSFFFFFLQTASVRMRTCIPRRGGSVTAIFFR